MSVRHTDPTTKIVEETYVGCVLDEYEDNGYHDSYGYAIVWDDEKGVVTTVQTWSTAYYTTTGATVDATPETIKKAKAYAAKILFEQRIKDHKIVGTGKTVKSLTVRGKAKGVTGTVEQIKRDEYARAYGDIVPKVAVIKVTAPFDNPHYGRNLYVKPDRLEVIDELTEDVKIDYKQEAWLEAERSSVRSLFHPRYGALYRPSELYR
jgi:hypothetical protein